MELGEGQKKQGEGELSLWADVAPQGACRSKAPPPLQGTLTMSTWPQIIRLRFLVKVPTKSTRAGRKLGGPVSTRHWGLKRGRKKGMSHWDRAHKGLDANSGTPQFPCLLGLPC